MTNFPQPPISLSSPPPASEMITMEADAKTRKELARACDVILFESAIAHLRVKRWRKHGIAITGEFKAKLKQECVVTLEPLVVELNEAFERHFLPDRGRGKQDNYKTPDIIDGEMILDPEASDLPDIVEGDTVNLWEVLCEELNLVIDPFPRSQTDAGFVDKRHETAAEETDKPTHKPFAELKTLITEKKTK